MMQFWHRCLAASRSNAEKLVFFVFPLTSFVLLGHSAQEKGAV